MTLVAAIPHATPCERDPHLYDDESLRYEAAETCHLNCHRVAECLTEVMKLEATGTRIPFVVGGMTYNQRAQLRAGGRPKREPRRPPAPCGTVAARQRHIKTGEPIDRACAAAFRKYHAERDHKKRDPDLCAVSDAVEGRPHAELNAHERRIAAGHLAARGLATGDVAYRLGVSARQAGRLIKDAQRLAAQANDKIAGAA